MSVAAHWLPYGAVSASVDSTATLMHVTARWISGAHETDAGVPDLKAALEDIQDVEAADIVVSFTETGDVPGRSRGGRHVEFGYALAKGKRLIVVGTRENVFHHVPGVEMVGSVAQLFRLLGAEASNGKAW